MTMAGVQLWERREKETSKAFAAFVVYRDQDPLERSIKQAARDVGKSEQQFTRWSNRHDWVVRAGAYDDFVDGRRVEKNVDLLDAMAIRQAEAAKRLQEIAILSLARLQGDMIVNPNLRLKDGNIMQFLTQGAAMERIARGDPAATPEELTGTIKVIWKGPTIASDDASDASGPVERPPE